MQIPDYPNASDFDSTVQVLKPHRSIQTIKRGEEEVIVRRYHFEEIPEQW